MAMDYNKALGKYRKLSALAESPEPHEAEAARRQAEALMREHNFTDEDCKTPEPEGHMQCFTIACRYHHAPEWLYDIYNTLSYKIDFVAFHSKGKIYLCGDYDNVLRAYVFGHELLVAVRAARLAYIAKRSPIVPLKRKDRMVFLRRIRREYERGFAVGLIVGIGENMPDNEASSPDDALDDEGNAEELYSDGVQDTPSLYQPVTESELHPGSAFWNYDLRRTALYTNGMDDGREWSSAILHNIVINFDGILRKIIDEVVHKQSRADK